MRPMEVAFCNPKEIFVWYNAACGHTHLLAAVQRGISSTRVDAVGAAGTVQRSIHAAHAKLSDQGLVCAPLRNATEQKFSRALGTETAVFTFE